MPTIRPERQFDPKIKQHSHSRKDYSFHKTFKFGAPVFEPELLFLSPVLDQGNTPQCTAYSAVATRYNEKGNKVYDPAAYWQDECTFDGQPVTQNGTSPKTAMGVGVKTGFVPVGQTTHVDTASAYFSVTPNNGMDQFDSIRAAIKYKNGPARTFLIWFDDWDMIYDVAKSDNGIVPNSFVTESGGHAVKIAGWKTINNVPYLVVQNSWGDRMGDNGLFYFSRAIANRVFGSQGWTYVWSDTANVQIQRLGLLAALFQNLLNLIQSLKGNQPSGFPPPAPPVPPAPVYHWDNPVAARLSVRELCDAMGLPYDQKKILCACVEVESNFNPLAVHYNKDKTGVAWSADWGIVQINDYFHIGTGKDFPSVDFVQQNPEACVRWMIKMFQAGKQSMWSSYSQGLYKKYL